MSQPDNFRRSAQFREMVALALAAEGLPVTLPGKPLKLSESLAEDAPPLSRSHFAGPPGWTIHARAELRANLGENLDKVTDASIMDGTAHGGVIQYRRGRPAPEQFVVMELATFAALVKMGQL